MPTVFLPGIGATMRTLGTLEVQGQVVGQGRHLVDAQAGLQGDFVLRDDRPGIDADDAHLELKSVNVFSSSAASSRSSDRALRNGNGCGSSSRANGGNSKFS